MRPIKEYEGIYSITDEGDIWSHKSNQWMKYRKRRGYWCVNLSKNNQKRAFNVHRLVAEAYLHNPLDKSVVSFKDKNPDNLHASNLFWATQKEAIEGRNHYTGNMNMPSLRVFSDYQIKEIRRLREKFSCKDLGASYGVSASCISLICRRETYKDVE